MRYDINFLLGMKYLNPLQYEVGFCRRFCKTAKSDYYVCPLCLSVSWHGTTCLPQNRFS